MTKKVVEIVIKRYRHVSDAIEQDLDAAVFYVGKRKIVIKITEDVKSIYNIVEMIYNKEENRLMKLMIKYILDGENDVFIMDQIKYSKNSYYPRKQAFKDKVYKCCIALNLVSLEEVLGEEIA